MPKKIFLGRPFIVAITLSVIGMLIGCHGNRNYSLSIPEDTTSANDNTTASNTTSSDGESLPSLSAEDMAATLFDSFTGLQTIHFDFDSYALRADAREILKKNAEKIKQTPGVLIQIEGHCDERGTQEYNMALGEKRALATRDYLIKLGVDPNRLITISYGEEDPIDPGHNEAAWAKNRRAEFNRGRRQ